MGSNDQDNNRGGMSNYAKAAAYVGLATITPISGYVGYLFGGWLQRDMGWSGAETTGLLVGCAAGIYETFRQAMRIEGFSGKKK